MNYFHQQTAPMGLELLRELFCYKQAVPTELVCGSKTKRFYKVNFCSVRSNMFVVKEFLQIPSPIGAACNLNKQVTPCFLIQ